MATKKTPKAAATTSGMASDMKEMASGVFAPVSKNSPFADGYDIESERVNLSKLIDSMEDPDPLDPLYPRYLEYINREDELKEMVSRDKGRNHAESIVPSSEATGLTRLGGLVPEAQATMELHTKQAYRLFIGKAPNREARNYGEVSAKKAAAMLRMIWALSSNDNPYADLALIVTAERIASVKEQINKNIGAKTKLIASLAERGMKLPVLRSRNPVKVELGFNSPYGFLLAELILDFDFYTRIITTLTRSARLTDAEGRQELYSCSRQIRSIFERIVPVQRALTDERLKDLTRADWASSDSLAQKRVRASVEVFKPHLGMMPRDVFTGVRAPAFSKRRVDLSQEEILLLQSVLLGDSVEADTNNADLV